MKMKMTMKVKRVMMMMTMRMRMTTTMRMTMKDIWLVQSVAEMKMMMTMRKMTMMRMAVTMMKWMMISMKRMMTKMMVTCLMTSLLRLLTSPSLLLEVELHLNPLEADLPTREAQVVEVAHLAFHPTEEVGAEDSEEEMAAAAVAEISVVVVEDFQLIAAVVDHLASHPTGVAGEEEEEEEDSEEATVEAVDSEVEEEVAAVEDVDDFNKNLFKKLITISNWYFKMHVSAATIHFRQKQTYLNVPTSMASTPIETAPTFYHLEPL
jgi:hypothetical protein